MKNFILIFLLFIFSCQKDIRSPNIYFETFPENAQIGDPITHNISSSHKQSIPVAVGNMHYQQFVEDIYTDGLGIGTGILGGDERKDGNRQNAIQQK